MINGYNKITGCVIIMSKQRIIIYTQTGCSACKNTKDYLAGKGVAFDERNVTEDEEALRELTETYKSRSTPTIVIGDEVIIGFDKEKLNKRIS